MLRSILLLVSCLVSSFLIAQNNPAPDSTYAKVDVVVTDMKGKPSKGEQVSFKSEVTQKVFSGKSNAAGKFSLTLPPGSKYIITLKTITDSTRYGVIDIPALGPDEFFTEPFKVNVKFELAKKYTLDNVHFDVGKATLRPESYKELEELADYLSSRDQVKIEIAGHTDNVGKDADNLRLSQQRADAIKAWLVKKGIATTRVVAKGYGASQPVADNDTDEGKQLNRRTEVRVL